LSASRYFTFVSYAEPDSFVASTACAKLVSIIISAFYQIICDRNDKINDRNFHNFSFQIFVGLNYPFSDEKIDLIVTRYAFHHFPDVINAVQQMNRILVKEGKVLISDPMKNEKDDNRIIDNFMRAKKDGHIQFYSSNELDELFINNGFAKEKQVITEFLVCLIKIRNA